MEIMQAGTDIEAAIGRNMAEIDETMLELLRRRMEAAKQLERRGDVIEGMALLLRRLKGEVDRKNASASMRLLDSLLALSEGEVREGKEKGGRILSRESRAECRRRMQAKLRVAFSVGPLDIDIVAVAAQLAASGQEVAEELMQDIVQPSEFIDEVNSLIERVGEQQRQLEEVLAGLPQGDPRRLQGEQVISDRAAALSQVEEILSMAIAVQKQL